MAFCSVVFAPKANKQTKKQTELYIKIIFPYVLITLLIYLMHLFQLHTVNSLQNSKQKGPVNESTAGWHIYDCREEGSTL